MIKVVLFLMGSVDFGWQNTVITGLLIAAMWGLLYRFTFRIKLTNHNLRIRYGVLIRSKYKIPLEDITFVEFVEIPEAALWSGWGIPFSSNCHVMGIGDNKALHLRTSSGESFYIFSNKLYEQKQRINHLLRA
ncbi:MAG TPA: PH domain-containing protein [Saprospiraceae bacterium]|nr:PH domain-containing protein [Saprospiraceae bacterium]HMQ85519.1 PH domain-containing protein [Saprospiraceae bacterium]